jgi:hypothetical protein
MMLCAIMCYCIQPATAQSKKSPMSSQRKDFYRLLKQSNLNFTFPQGFQEIKAVNNEDFSFDFALQDPENNCEVWMMVRSQKQNWQTYDQTQTDQKDPLSNPDSMYMELSKAYATTLTGNNTNAARDMPTDVLQDYNADAGKSYLLNLLDLPVTHHYKYALIVALQKNHTGTLIAVYFTNYKDPDFYRDVNLASHCFKFNP